MSGTRNTRPQSLATFDQLLWDEASSQWRTQQKSILEQLTGETSNLRRQAHLEKAKKRNQLNDEIRKLYG